MAEEMDYEEAAIELLRIQAQFNRLKANREMDGFTQGEFFALACLYENGRKAYPKELSEKMFISSARVAVLLNHMEKKGWVCRLADETDNRKTLVSLTKSGENMYLSRQREVLDSVIRVLEDLGEDDTKNLLRIRKKMLK